MLRHRIKSFIARLVYHRKFGVWLGGCCQLAMLFHGADVHERAALLKFFLALQACV